MPMLTPNHTFSTFGGPEAFTSTTIFEKCGAKLYQDRKDIQKTH